MTLFRAIWRWQISIPWIPWTLVLLLSHTFDRLSVDCAEEDLGSSRGALLLLGSVQTAVLVMALILTISALPERFRRAGRRAAALLVAAALVYRFADSFFFAKLGYHLSTGFRLLLSNGVDETLRMLRVSGVSPADALGKCAVAAACALVLTLLVEAGLRGKRSAVLAPAPLVLCSSLALASILMGFQMVARSDPSWPLWKEYERVFPYSVGWRIRPSAVAFAGAQLRRLGAGETWPSTACRTNEVGALRDPGAPASEPARRPLPDIFVFVLEGLRGDAVRPDAAPFMYQLRSEALPVHDSLAGGNATHLSWYALLTGNYSLRIGAAIAGRLRPGSPILRQFVDAGYVIHAYCGAGLNHFGIERIVFGEHQELARTLFDDRSMVSMDRPARDAKATSLLLDELGRGKGGRIFLLFLDSTHYVYDWPSGFTTPFKPYSMGLGFFDQTVTEEHVEEFRNRYLNSVYYDDSLVGSVIERLKATGDYEKSVIFVTGDHGEEFNEHGRFFHASESCRVQTHVPWILKLASDPSPPAGRKTDHIVVSHCDLLPSLADYLGLPHPVDTDGEPIWCKSVNLAVVAEQNRERDPFRFALQLGDLKATFQYFGENTQIELDHDLFLLKVTDRFDQTLAGVSGAEVARSTAWRMLEDARSRVFPGVRQE